MPNLWDKVPEAPAPSELNPLTNPVLEQNLRRWAQVYFSAPPAKREQAVSALLEEIRRESELGGVGQNDRPYFATDPKFRRAVCSACQHQNPPGHKFCSRCGRTLGRAQSAVTESISTESIPAEDARTSGVPEAPPPSSDDDLQWQRPQAFSGLENSGSQTGRAWKYLAGAAVIVLAGFAYVHWAPSLGTRLAPASGAAGSTPQVAAPAEAALPPQNSSPSESPAPAQAMLPQSNSPQSNSTQSSPTQSGPTQAHDARSAADAHDRAVVPPGIQAAAQKSPLLDAASSRQRVAVQEGGVPDLRLAQRYLQGGMGARDASEAAKLLWKAVGQQNATAAILLSDLYLRGDGVPRSCDQARLLLVAAAKRGSPQAAQQLRNMEAQGCQ